MLCALWPQPLVYILVGLDALSRQVLEDSKQQAKSLRQEETAEFQTLKADALEAKELQLIPNSSSSFDLECLLGIAGPFAEGRPALERNLFKAYAAKSYSPGTQRTWRSPLNSYDVHGSCGCHPCEAFHVHRALPGKPPVAEFAATAGKTMSNQAGT